MSQFTRGTKTIIPIVHIELASVLLAGCSSTPESPAVTDSTTPASSSAPKADAKLSASAYLAKMQTDGRLSVMTVANVDQYSQSICDQIAATPTPEFVVGTAIGLGLTAKDTPMRNRVKFTLLVTQYCTSFFPRVVKIPPAS